MSYTVLVCDDDSQLAARCVEEIEALKLAEYEIHTEPNKFVHDSTNELLGRRRAIRDNKRRPREECTFDRFDILIIDYDLIHIDENNTEYTGESLARLVRTFSECAVVVILNQFGPIDFDLRLRGHLESHADLNIPDNQIANPGLWRRPPWDGFRPWYWQTLFEAVESQRSRERVLRAGLNEPIIDMFGITAEDASRLSDSAFSFISQDVEDFEGLRKTDPRRVSSKGRQTVVMRRLYWVHRTHIRLFDSVLPGSESGLSERCLDLRMS